VLLKTGKVTTNYMVKRCGLSSLTVYIVT